MKEIQSIVKEQKAFFNTGQTKDAGFRKTQLDTLQKAIGENRAKILAALQQDLSKSAYEGYLTEVGIVLDEIRFIHEFYGADPQLSTDYPRIVNEKHFLRLAELMQAGNIIAGGQSDRQSLYIAPTIIDDIAWDDPIMQHEIFGPLLPVLAYNNLSQAISRVKELPKPLAFYYFSNNRQNGEQIIREASFGGGCINDTLLHFANPHLPFGGTGSSGIGSYHGKKSFETFSHQKSILKRSFRLDVPLRYPPYGNKLKILEKIMR
jgi:aldehyde dehydrogenase (NAD+)